MIDGAKLIETLQKSSRFCRLFPSIGIF